MFTDVPEGSAECEIILSVPALSLYPLQLGGMQITETPVYHRDGFWTHPQELQKDHIKFCTFFFFLTCRRLNIHLKSLEKHFLDILVLLPCIFSHWASVRHVAAQLGTALKACNFKFGLSEKNPNNQ